MQMLRLESKIGSKTDRAFVNIENPRSGGYYLDVTATSQK